MWPAAAAGLSWDGKINKQVKLINSTQSQSQDHRFTAHTGLCTVHSTPLDACGCLREVDKVCQNCCGVLSLSFQISWFWMPHSFTSIWNRNSELRIGFGSRKSEVELGQFNIFSELQFTIMNDWIKNFNQNQQKTVRRGSNCIFDLWIAPAILGRSLFLHSYR